MNEKKNQDVVSMTLGQVCRVHQQTHPLFLSWFRKVSGLPDQVLRGQKTHDCNAKEGGGHYRVDMRR